MNWLAKWRKQTFCRHWFDEPFWVGHSDVRPFQVQICVRCGAHKYTYQD